MRTFAVLTAALVAGGCATTSTQLTLMPRDSGKLYTGHAEGSPGYEGRVSITIENKTYTGTWVTVVAERTSGWVGGGWGYGRWGGWGAGAGTYHIDNPHGGEAKALLTAADGSGLRCDFRGSWGQGGGMCRDDRGREYDVQMRPAPPRG